MGLEPRREKKESCITCRRMLGMTPFPPTNLGGKHIWKNIPYLGIVYSESFYTGNMADNVKGSFWRQLITGLRNATLTLCLSKAEQLQAIHAVATGNDVFVKPATVFGKSVCYIYVPLICL